MLYIPHEKLSIRWANNKKNFFLSLPWLSKKIHVAKDDEAWIIDAIDLLHKTPSHKNVQRLLHTLKDYPLFYLRPRPLKEFQNKALQPCREVTIDTSTPSVLLATFDCDISQDLRDKMSPTWTWERDKILEKAQISKTSLYDPLSFISSLQNYRLEWETREQLSQTEFGELLEALLKQDEDQFFQTVGFLSKQSWYLTTHFHHCLSPAFISFHYAQDQLHHLMCKEAAHSKFIEEVFRDLNFEKNAFLVGAETTWLLTAYRRAAMISPLAFSAMTHLFEIVYQGEIDPLARVLKLSSKPHAAQGFDLHSQINQYHRHCDRSFALASWLGPQTEAHATLTLGLYEMTLTLLHHMKQDLVKGF